MRGAKKRLSSKMPTGIAEIYVYCCVSGQKKAEFYAYCRVKCREKNSHVQEIGANSLLLFFS